MASKPHVISIFLPSLTHDYVCRPALRLGDAERLWHLQPGPLGTPLGDVCETAAYAVNACPHELWLALDLDDAKRQGYSKFTLRISWPASVRAYVV